METGQESDALELQKAVDQFNREEWFECHETLEELWVGAKGESRDFYQGLLQVAVALHHWRNGNFKGAVGLLRRGGDLLRRVSPRLREVEVARLAQDAAAMQEALEGLGEERMGEVESRLVPRVRRAPPH